MQSQSAQNNNNPIIIHPKVKNKNIRKHNIKSNGSCFIVFGVVTLILGASLFILQDYIMSSIAEFLLKLDSDTFAYNIWKNYPVKVPMIFTFFNWTNREEFLNKSVKPKFEEIGPYAYLQRIERVNVIRNHNNDTVTFQQTNTFHYNNDFPNNGNLSDRLMTINYFAMLTGHLGRDWDIVSKDVLSEFLSMTDPYYYFDTMVDDELQKGSKNLIMELSHYFDFIIPDLPRFDGFGWIKFRDNNPSFSGVFNMKNGVNRQFDLLNWNYRTETPFFEGSCAKVKGSLGDIYSFPINKESMFVFSPELCRYLQLYFEEEMVVEGILGYKYSLNELSIDNGTLIPENKCFCNERCIPSGLFSLDCQFHSNMFVSLPHFYLADTSYLNAFEGLKPNKEIHESYLVIEPNTLLCLKFKISVQVNTFVYPVEGVSLFEEFPKLYFPLFWMTHEGQLPDEVKTYLNIYLKVPYAIMGFATIFVILGICLFACGLFRFQKFRLLKNCKADKDLIVKSEQVPLFK